MREIRFRAWDGEKMDYFLREGVVGEIMPIIFDGNNHRIIYFNAKVSEPVQLMQFTGLKDSKGVEIYENDFIKFATSERVYRVGWSMGGFHAVPIDKPHDSSCKDWVGVGHTDNEVLGNIHEDPSLLEGMKKGV